jgi:ABC-type branched-subunit amino acid transport system substrate-binding protein
MVNELEKRNLTKVVLFGTNQPGVLAVADEFKKGIVGSKVSVVSEQIFNGGETDMRSYISKAISAKGDIFLILASSPEVEILTKQIREQKINTPITSIESFEFSNETALFNGQWYVGPAVADESFAQEYMKTGKSPLFGSANMYDVIRLIITATEKGKGGKLTPETLLRNINSIKDFPGALGILNFDKDGIILSKAIVKVMENGVPVVAK